MSSEATPTQTSFPKRKENQLHNSQAVPKKRRTQVLKELPQNSIYAPSSQGARGGQSQPKSSFEEDLGRLTQEIQEAGEGIFFSK
jgi:hypothetical protein